MQTKKMSVPFTQVANSIINDPNLSFKAKGIYAYIYSKPDGWDFAVRRIAEETCEERRAIESGIKELEDAGYLKREKLSTGRMLYIVLYPPEPGAQNVTLGVDEPGAQKAKVLKSQGAKTAPISNKYNKKEIGQEINNTSEPSSRDIPETIKAFEAVNPACSRFYGNKTQRRAVEELLNIHGFDRLIKIITVVLPKTNGMLYAPTITTPLQLLEKFAALEAAVKKARGKEAAEQKQPPVVIINGVPVKL